MVSTCSGCCMNSSMLVLHSKISGLLVLVPDVHADKRGFFYESFNQKSFTLATGLSVNFVQDNHSKSALGVVRGLHFQAPPHAQGKLVRVISGSIWDVAVDIRKNSPTFGQWAGEELTSSNRKQRWIPPGFAHGFLATSEATEVAYKTDGYYSAEHENSILWNDKSLSVSWPELSTQVTLSEKDSSAMGWKQALGLL
jgi:dTDP-4-dehydrorhamnose 3,5-epimerase